VTHPLEFTARVAPVQEATLFFRADGHLARLLEARDVASTRNPTGLSPAHIGGHTRFVVGIVAEALSCIRPGG